MKIRKSALGAEAAASAYADRYRRRGEAHAPKTRRTDKRRSTIIWPEDDFAYRSKPNHAARAVALPIFHLGNRKRPLQKEHPATAPLTDVGRHQRYSRQRPGRPLTARQRRRMNHKLNRAIGRRSA